MSADGASQFPDLARELQQGIPQERVEIVNLSVQRVERGRSGFPGFVSMPFCSALSHDFIPPPYTLPLTGLRTRHFCAGEAKDRCFPSSEGWPVGPGWVSERAAGATHPAAHAAPLPGGDGGSHVPGRQQKLSCHEPLEGEGWGEGESAVVSPFAMLFSRMPLLAQHSPGASRPSTGLRPGFPL